jgi:hypothetical protein
MLEWIQTTMNPAGYHGRRVRPPFFEGWYFKLVSPGEGARFAFIPGISLASDPAHSHAFVQVLDGMTGASTYHTYPVGEFWAAKRGFEIHVGPNRFSASGVTLDIPSLELPVRGAVRFANPSPVPWPVTPASPGIMGWYGWIPFMECYHGVLSFDHGLDGALEIDGRRVDFTGGRGYIEKDWGRSFPAAWVWFQTNHFAEPGVCLTASLAVIPWRKSAFPGCIVGLWHSGRLYRFATYTGARTRGLEVDDTSVRWEIAGNGLVLEMLARRGRGGLLQAPTPTGMDRRIAETLDARVRVCLRQEDGAVLYEGEGGAAGLEAVGDMDRLRTMIFPQPRQ